MPERPERAHHELQEVPTPGFELRCHVAEKRRGRAVRRAVRPQREDVEAQHALIERLGPRARRVGVRQSAERRRGGVRAHEQVVAQPKLAAGPARLRTEVRARHLRHVAAVAVGGGLLGPVPALHTDAAAVGESPGVVVVLPRQPLVVVELLGKEHLVAGGAELGAAMHRRLEEGLLVERRLPLDELVVHPGEERAVASAEGVLRALLDHVVGVPARGMDRGDGVARRAGDAGCTERVLRHVVVRVVVAGVLERTREERHGIMAPRAEPRVVHLALALEGAAPRLAHAEGVHRVVEAAGRVRAVRPRGIRIRVAGHALVVLAQRPFRDEGAVGRAREARLEVRGPVLRPGPRSRSVPAVPRIEPRHQRQ